MAIIARPGLVVIGAAALDDRNRLRPGPRACSWKPGHP
jgi:hypothetical protein